MTRVLERLIADRGCPENVRSDNGRSLFPGGMLGWVEGWKVGLVHIQPGRPMQNGHVEGFHGRLRDECLNARLAMCGRSWQTATLNLATGYGDVESKLRFPHPHSPEDGGEINISEQDQIQKTPVLNGWDETHSFETVKV